MPADQPQATPTATPAPLVIKRYASRRLYNTESSDYVTLEDIAALVRTGREVRIIDLKSGDDLTRQYLLQIIAEHEGRGESVLPIDVLTELVRSYTSSSQSIVPQFLAASFEMLRESQTKMIENLSTIPSPIQNIPVFEAMQRQQKAFIRAMYANWPVAGSILPTEEKPDTAPKDESIEEIQRQLAELQKKISRM